MLDDDYDDEGQPIIIKNHFGEGNENLNMQIFTLDIFATQTIAIHIFQTREKRVCKSKVYQVSVYRISIKLYHQQCVNDIKTCFMLSVKHTIEKL